MSEQKSFCGAETGEIVFNDCGGPGGAYIPHGTYLKSIQETTANETERPVQQQVCCREGCSYQISGLYLGGAERGLRNIGVLNILKLARTLECEPGDLLRF